jgi:hypothetical protein
MYTSDRPRIRRKYVTTKLCPNCLNKLDPIDELSGWVTPEEYVCSKCGYVGRVALERSEDEPKG